MSDSAAELVFDPDALRERYRVERDKRLREDANEQYVEMTGSFAHYLEDPYVDEKTERKPVTDEVDVVLIGGGFGGLQAGARLRDAGIKDIKIIEKGGAFGGTWYWNRYPGAQCDIEAYCYLPLLEELNYIQKKSMPSRGKFWITVRRLVSISTCTIALCFRQRSQNFAGMNRSNAG